MNRIIKSKILISELSKMLREQKKVRQNLIGGKKFEPSSVRHLQVSPVTKPWEEDIKSPTWAITCIAALMIISPGACD